MCVFLAVLDRSNRDSRGFTSSCGLPDDRDSTALRACWKVWVQLGSVRRDALERRISMSDEHPDSGKASRV